MYAMYEESSTANSGADWNERPSSTRPANLAQDDNPQHIPISASNYSCTEHEGTAGKSDHPMLKESEFITSSSKVNSTSIKGTRERGRVANYGAITLGHDGDDEESRSPSSQERRQPSATGGQAYEKVASRNKRAEHATTNTETAMHLLKGNIGIGLLALPLAVYNAGLIVGAVGLLLMGLIATHCMMQLVSCSKELCRRLGVETLDYAEVAQFAVLEYTKKQIWGKIARFTVNLFLLITQFGFCCAYFVFMAYSLDQVFCVTFDANIGQRAWIGILIPPMVVLSWIRNLNELASFSMVANVCILITLVIILYEEINSFITDDDDEKAAVLKGSFDLVSIATLPLFFGKAVYAYEGIGIILPLENKMKKHEDALRVIFFSMMVVTILFTLFGVVGYVVYGSDIKASITLNLISTNIFEVIIYIIAKIFFAYATLASFLLQFYVPMDFLEPPILERMNPKSRNDVKLLIQILFRSVVVLFIGGIAMAIPDLEDLISLIGAVASSTLALIFPSILSIMIFWPIRREVSWLGCLPWSVWVVKDALIALLGVVGTVFGTYASIDNIIAYFQADDAAEKACDITYFPW